MSTTIASISCGQPGCDRSFGSETARESHLRYQHQLGVVDPLGFPCRVSTCTASFGTSLNRDEHMREAHRTTPSTSPDEIQQQAERLGVRVPGSAGAVSTTPAAPVAVEEDTSDDLSEDAGSSPAPRSSEDVPSATLGGGGGHEAMATMYVCGEAGCDAKPFKTAQAVGAHRFRAHGIRTKPKPEKPPAKRGRPRKAPTGGLVGVTQQIPDSIPIVDHGVGKGWPRVAGRCPSCGLSSLFLAAGGHVTCMSLICRDPLAASELLEGKP